MNNKEEAKEFLRKAEGFRSKVYLDSGGLPTIGYGQTKANADYFMPGMWKEWQKRGITKEEAENLLDLTLNYNIREYSRNVPNFYKLNDNQKQAFYVLSYLYPNLFSPNLRDKKLKTQADSIKQLMLNEQFDKIPDLIRFGEDTRNSNGTLKHPGLVKRWNSWAQLYHTGIAPDNIYEGDINDPNIKDRSKQKYLSKLGGKIKEVQSNEDPMSEYNNNSLHQKMISDANAIYDKYMRDMEDRKAILEESQRAYVDFQKGMAEMSTTPTMDSNKRQQFTRNADSYIAGSYLDNSSNYNFNKFNIPAQAFTEKRVNSYADQELNKFGLGGELITGLNGFMGIGNAMANNLNPKDTSTQQSMYANAPSRVGNFNNNHDLLKSWSNQSNLPSVNFNEIDNTNIGNSLSAIGHGAMAGYQLGGPWGAAIGGGIGLIGGIYSHFKGSENAKKRFRELNGMRTNADWQVNNKFNAQASNIEYDTDSLLARQFI